MHAISMLLFSTPVDPEGQYDVLLFNPHATCMHCCIIASVLLPKTLHTLLLGAHCY